MRIRAIGFSEAKGHLSIFGFLIDLIPTKGSSTRILFRSMEIYVGRHDLCCRS